jgi:hypothetical protein
VKIVAPISPPHRMSFLPVRSLFLPVSVEVMHSVGLGSGTRSGSLVVRPSSGTSVDRVETEVNGYSLLDNCIGISNLKLLMAVQSWG